MTIDEMKTVLLAQQDQDMEDAKKWVKGSAGPGQFNAQVISLWDYCCDDHPRELVDVASRFALIGLRHVLATIEA